MTKAVALVATLFGLITLVAGFRVLLGGDPGYTVYSPILQFNTAMGVVYIVVGLLAWLGYRAALPAAAATVGLNVFALVVISYVAATGGSVAVTSLAAMTFRVIVWIALLVLLARQWKRAR